MANVSVRPRPPLACRIFIREHFAFVWNQQRKEADECMYVLALLIHHCLYSLSHTHSFQEWVRILNILPWPRASWLTGVILSFPFSLSLPAIFFLLWYCVFLLQEQTVCFCYEANLYTSTFSTLIAYLYLSWSMYFNYSEEAEMLQNKTWEVRKKHNILI